MHRSLKIEASLNMKTTVKKWFADKGFGFLHNGTESAPDILVHSSELKNCTYLKPGRIVEFDCHFNDKGLLAKNVHLIAEEQTAKGKVNTLFNDHWHRNRYSQ